LGLAPRLTPLRDAVGLAAFGALALLVSSARADETTFAAPAPSVLEQLQSLHRPSDWLRVTMGATELELRARQIDEAGLSHLSGRGSGKRRLRAYTSSSLSGATIPWSSISRIDRLHSKSRGGGVVGFVTGGIAGAAIIPQPYVGAMLGCLGGSWLGGRIGDRFAHPHRFYVGQPLPASSANPVAASPEPTPPVPDSALAQQRVTPATEPEPTSTFREPAAREATPAPPIETPRAVDPTREVRRACRALEPDNLLRMDTDFGRFQGYASRIGPEGLDGLRADVRAGFEPAPAGLVTWNRIHRLEKSGGSAARGAAMGAMFVGTAGAALGVLVVLAASGLGGDVDATGAIEMVGIGALGGAALGAGAGGLIGAPIQGWHVVYRRPVGRARVTESEIRR
jgi:hypothetical protein